MSIEEKYNKALNTAKDYLESGSYDAEFLKDIFPELRENEDERIRKAIIHYILYETKGTISEATEHTWVKWLEKQKENPKTADSIPSDCTSDAKCEDRSPKHSDSDGTDIRDTPAYWRGWDDAMKQKEQKEWSEEDLEHIKSIIHRTEVYGGNCLYGRAKEDLEWLKNLLNRFLIQPKPVEWSEEDESIIEGACNALEVYGHTKLANKLKSLRPQQKQEWSEVELEFRGEKVKVKRPFFRDDKGHGYSTTEQDDDVAWYALRAWCEKKGVSLYDLYPREEWSEDGERIIDTIVSVLGQYIDYKTVSGTGSGYATPKYNKEIDWLKSLRPQPKEEGCDYITPNKKFFQWIYDRLVYVHKENPNMDYMMSFKKRIDNLVFDQYHWKPSEEQMDSLRDTIIHAKGYSYSMYLPELYEQLKKL